MDPKGQIFSQVDASYFDREENPEFKVVIQAKDKGREPLSSTATLTIKLLDINDNAPEFTEDIYKWVGCKGIHFYVNGSLQEMVMSTLGKNGVTQVTLKWSCS